MREASRSTILATSSRARSFSRACSLILGVTIEAGKRSGVKRWSRDVSRILCPTKWGEGHSSGRTVACSLWRPTREIGAGHSSSPLFGLAPHGVCRAAGVAAGAGGLLPHRFTVAGTGRSPAPAVYSLLHFPSRRRDWELPSVLPWGVRTFLSEVTPERPSPRLQRRDYSKRELICPIAGRTVCYSPALSRL